MPVPAFKPLRPAPIRALAVLCAASAVVVAGCGTVQRASQKVTTVVRPYQPMMVQGNFVSREQAAALQPGMVREQVRDILGSPLVASVFHADRWDYAFTLRRGGAEPQAYRLSVFFKDNALERVESDTLPTEAEFAEVLDDRNAPTKVPRLEATEAQLSRFRQPAASAPAGAASGPAAAPAPAPAPAPSTLRYPPLEPAAR
jgi:outer membrane protein assembly factor BamE